MTKEEDKLTPEEERAKRIGYQEMILQSGARVLAVAFSTRDKAKFGEEGSQDVFNLLYKGVLDNADPIVGRIATAAFAEASKTSSEPYTGTVNELALLQSAVKLYSPAVENSRVITLLGLSGIESEELVKRYGDMTLAELKEKNPDEYKLIKGNYERFTQKSLVGQSMQVSAGMGSKGLEKKLLDSPKKEK